MVATGNPPITDEGQWVVRYWGPWLDPNHPRPAKPGELRWFVVSADGKNQEVQGPAWGPERAPAVRVDLGDGPRWVRPRSRTYIPSTVEDNPDYMRTGYAEVLDALPEPLRRMRFGDFASVSQDDARQIIPSAWVAAAQARWSAGGGEVPLSAVGVDVSRGGQDEFVVASRRGAWVGPLCAHPASAAPDGPAGALLVLAVLNGDAGVVVQVDSGGPGVAVVDALRLLGLRVVALNGAEASRARTRDGRFGFYNRRAEWHWRLREALNPASGQDLALPPDPQLRADLCAPRWELELRGIKVEDKDAIRTRLGRSPDRGEAVIYACASAEPAVLHLLFSGGTTKSDAEELAMNLAAIKARLGLC